MAWVYLLIAGIIEICWATSLKYTGGFTRFWPSVGNLVLGLISLVLLAQAVKTIPTGTAYAIWTGIGAAGAAMVGILLFGESGNPMRILCIGVVLAGIIGLKLTSN